MSILKNTRITFISKLNLISNLEETKLFHINKIKTKLNKNIEYKD